MTEEHWAVPPWLRSLDAEDSYRGRASKLICYELCSHEHQASRVFNVWRIAEHHGFVLPIKEGVAWCITWMMVWSRYQSRQ